MFVELLWVVDDKDVEEWVEDDDDEEEWVEGDDEEDESVELRYKSIKVKNTALIEPILFTAVCGGGLYVCVTTPLSTILTTPLLTVTSCEDDCCGLSNKVNDCDGIIVLYELFEWYWMLCNEESKYCSYCGEENAKSWIVISGGCEGSEPALGVYIPVPQKETSIYSYY